LIFDKPGVAISVSLLALSVATWAAWQQAHYAARNDEAVSGHSLVLDTRATFAAQLKGPLRHGRLLNVRFRNMSTVTKSYEVSVRSEGLLISRLGVNHSEKQQHIRFGHRPIAIAKDGQFSDAFQVWLSSEPPTDATLELLIDDVIVDNIRLKYDTRGKQYVLHDAKLG
jgi:hypothetical protein